ncbi:acyltransferase family protein [Desulforhopalus sp. 52FAK]
MIKNTAFLIKCCLTLFFFFSLKVIISYTVLSNYNLITVDAEFSKKDFVDIYYSSGHGFQKNHYVRSQPFPAEKRITQKIYLNNNSAKYIRIDPGSGNGSIKLYGIRLVSYYGKSVSLNPKILYNSFEPNTNINTYAVVDNYLLIRTHSDDPFFISKEALQIDNFFLAHIFPLLLSIPFWIFLSSISYRSFPAFRDLNHKTSTTGVNITSLDGVRGLAALMVLAEHCGLVDGIGAIGVWLFFGLSGFLLATPFVHNPEKAYSISYLQSFLLRRLKRIIPLYYTYILITMLFWVKNPEIFRHLMFLQGDGHMWTIPQEMFFYLLLPFIMLLCCIPIARQKSYAILLLSTLIVISNTYLTLDVVSLYGYGKSLRPFVGIFLSGVLFAYIYYWLHTNTFFQKLNRSTRKHVFSFLGLTILITLVSLCPKEAVNVTKFNIQDHYGVVGFLTANFILCVVLSGDALLGKIMSFLPLRAVGLVGFSFYLLHPNLMTFFYSLSQYYFNFSLQGIQMFIVAGIATYFLSIFTYTYIERPFLITHKEKEQ